MGHLSAPLHPRRTLVNYEGRRVGGTELTGATLSPGLVRPTRGQDSDQGGRATLVVYIYLLRWEYICP